MSPALDPSFPPRLAQYAQVLTWCNSGHLDRAQVALFEAYAAIPSATLTPHEWPYLQDLADDLVYVGKMLPSLRPTLDLLHHLHGTCGPRPSTAPLSWVDVLDTSA